MEILKTTTDRLALNFFQLKITQISFGGGGGIKGQRKQFSIILLASGKICTVVSNVSALHENSGSEGAACVGLQMCYWLISSQCS